LVRAHDIAGVIDAASEGDVRSRHIDRPKLATAAQKSVLATAAVSVGSDNVALMVYALRIGKNGTRHIDGRKRKGRGAIKPGHEQKSDKDSYGNPSNGSHITLQWMLTFEHAAIIRAAWVRVFRK